MNSSGIFNTQSGLTKGITLDNGWEGEGPPSRIDARGYVRMYNVFCLLSQVPQWRS